MLKFQFLLFVLQQSNIYYIICMTVPLNKVFAESNSEITLALSSQDLSFDLDAEYSPDEDKDQREEDISNNDDIPEEDSVTIQE